MLDMKDGVNYYGAVCPSAGEAAFFKAFRTFLEPRVLAAQFARDRAEDFCVGGLMPESSGESKLSEIDTKQRHPLILFYFSALVFAAVLVFGGYVPSFWREGFCLLTVMVGAFGLWNFYQLLTLADERQRDTNNQALRFGFLVTLVLSS